MFIIFMVWTVINANTSRKTVIDRREDQQPDEKPLSVPKSIIYAVGGTSCGNMAEVSLLFIVKKS